MITGRMIMNKKLDIDKETDDGYKYTGTYILDNRIIGSLTIRDLVYIAILGIMGGFISSLVPFSLLMKVIYPFMGGTQLTSGHHLIWMSIAYGMTRKKSSPVITAGIKGIFEALLGDDWGAFIIVVNLLEGLILMFGFSLVEKYREGETNLGWAIAGGLGNFVQAPIFWLITGKIFILHFSLAIISFIFAFLSGCLITGLLGRIIVKLIKKAMGDT
jgi:ABC-type thiamin/hydroxymethylpyrimidine transport system permease subunit